MDIILFGIQGSGKGTQAKILAEKFQLKPFEMGAQLRTLAQENSELSLKVKTLIEAGHLVPADIVIEIAEKFIQKLQPGEKALFDGIPRNIEQKEKFDAVLKKYHRDFLGIQIEIPEEETIKRLLARGRNDDTPEGIKNRIDHFNRQTLPIIEDYKKSGKIVCVNGFQNVEEVAAEIMNKLNSSVN